jgi:uncharacterized protein YwgA
MNRKSLGSSERISTMDGRLVVLQRFIEALGEPTDISSMQARMRVQKAVYLGQLSGVDLGYRYSWYIHGPYCTALTKDYYALSAARDADETPGDQQLKPSMLKKLKTICDMLPVPKGINLDEPSWYELLASWHYLLTVSKLDRANANETMRRTKAHLVAHIPTADDVLKKNGLLLN